MRKTFACDETMIITIPIGSMKDIREGQLMPENFHCVFRDNFKVFTVRGKPRSLGAAQAIAGVFLVTLGILSSHNSTMTSAVPSVLFVIAGMLSYAAGRYPNMHVTKLAFSLNIISFFWSLVAFTMCAVMFNGPAFSNGSRKFLEGINGLIMVLLVLENMAALFLIYWTSKAICREQFNTLPIIMLKQD